MQEIVECKQKEIPNDFRFITINNENNLLMAEIPSIDEDGNYTIYSKRRKDGSKKEKYISFITDLENRKNRKCNFYDSL